MSNYVIGIGGSGIRVLRAIVHNCAAGVIDTAEIKMLAVDADWKSKVWTTLQQEYQEYVDMRNILRTSKKGVCFNTDINLMNKEGIISPVPYGNGGYKTLEQSIKPDDKLERIMKFFYTKEEREKELREGFFARPGIGCVFFSDFENDIFSKFLSELEEDIYKKIQTNVILIGSIFGGTGASGLPTIIKLIEEKIKHSKKSDISEKALKYLNIGAVFMLPYFKAVNYSEEEAIIKMGSFWKTAKEAMEYYKEEKYLEPSQKEWSRSLQRLYLIGQQDLDIVNYYAEGGDKQDNKPHIAEEYGALAIRDFLYITSKNDFNRKLEIFEWKLEKEISWEHLYYNKGEDDKSLKRIMGEFVQFTAIYHTCIYRYVYEANNKIGNPQWYKTYLQENRNEEAWEQLEAANSYCRDFLKWIYFIQSNLDIQDETKKYQYNEDIKLFRNVLENLNEILDIKPEEKTSDKVMKIIKQIKDNLGKLITVGADTKDILKNTVYILSKLNVYGLFNGLNGVPQLIADLCELVQGESR